MNGTLNKVMLIGHLGDDVKMHYFEGGGSIGRFPLATNESDTNGTDLMLAWPEKLQNEILSLFQTRYRLHKEVYTHHTVKSCEYVISDILKEMLGQVKTSFNLLNDSMINWPVSNKVIRLKRQFDARDIPKMIGEKVISYNEKNNQTLEFEKKLDEIIASL